MNGGYRSLMAFWMGGVSGPNTGPTPTYPTYPDPFAGTVSASAVDPFGGTVVSTGRNPDPFGGSIAYKRTVS